MKIFSSCFKFFKSTKETTDTEPLLNYGTFTKVEAEANFTLRVKHLNRMHEWEEIYTKVKNEALDIVEIYEGAKNEECIQKLYFLLNDPIRKLNIAAKKLLEVECPLLKFNDENEYLNWLTLSGFDSGRDCRIDNKVRLPIKIVGLLQSTIHDKIEQLTPARNKLQEDIVDIDDSDFLVFRSTPIKKTSN